MSLSAYGVADGLGLARDILGSEPAPGDAIDRYLPALQLARNLGPGAGVLVDSLEKLVRNPRVVESGYLPGFEHALRMVSGQVPVEVRVAKNGSGPREKITARHEPEGKPVPSDRRDQPFSEDPIRKSVVKPAADPPPSRIWLWITGCVAWVIAACAGLLRARRRLR